MAEQYSDIFLKQLRLDPENPRLPRDRSGEPSQDALLQFFAKVYNLVELGRSMADKGFSPRQAEALLVVEEPPGSGVYTVVEGNRRLATLLLLTGEHNRRLCNVGTEWNELAAKATAHVLDPVPAVKYDTRPELDSYLGFRHITGPTPWRPEAKARFVVALLRRGRPIQEIARTIGSNVPTVRRFAEASAIFEQVIALGLNADAVEGGFGIFYNALKVSGIRDFIGLRAAGELDPAKDQLVDDEHLEELKDLVSYLFGDEELALPRVIGESRKLRDLGIVLASPSAASLLRQIRDLDRAYRVAGGGKADLLAVLKDAYGQIIEANGQSVEFKSDVDVRDQVRRLGVLVADLLKRYDVAEDAADARRT